MKQKGAFGCPFVFSGFVRGSDGGVSAWGPAVLSSLRETVAEMRPFLVFLTGERRAFAWAAFWVVAVVASNAVLILLAGYPFQLLAEGDIAGLGAVLAAFAGVVLLNQGVHAAATLNANALGLRFVGRVRNRALQRLLEAGFPAVEGWERGDVLVRLSQDVDRVQQWVVEMPLFSFSHLLTLLSYAALLFWLDWRLALAASAWIPLFAVHQALFAGPKRRAAEAFLGANGRLLAFEEGAVRGLRGINGVAAEAVVATRHCRVFETARALAMRERYLDAAFSATLSLLVYGGALLVFAWGAVRVASGELGLGALTSFLLFLGYLSVPVRGLAQLPFQAQAGRMAGRRVLQLLQLSPPLRLRASAPPLRVERGAVSLQGVWFAYPGGEAVLRGVDLEIAPGETVALVGPSGSGKTTLAQLLARFRDPDAGRLCIDGQDLREVSLQSVRAQVGVMWQEPFLVDGDVRENLLLARPEADESALRAALEAAGAWAFVERLPQGMATPLGAGGVGLSAGQAQRLALARLFLRDPPILVLDEATSALDSESERRFVCALERLRRGRTTLLIAHRLASVRAAHRIAYLEHGVLRLGTHEELAASHPGYRAALEWQRGESGNPTPAG